MPLLKQGNVVGSDVSGDCYQVTSGRIAEGGFGEIYRGALLDGRRDPMQNVAINMLTHPLPWHGEAYFGRLLEDHDRVVRLFDAFQIASGSGAARLTKYLLVFEWMEDGTVWDFLEAGQGPLPEAAVVHQIDQILELLQLLHRRGICHGDITPRNAYLRDRQLVLGDLGIAKQGLHDGPIYLGASTPAAFAPQDALDWSWTPSLDWSWTPSDDVYQLVRAPRFGASETWPAPRSPVYSALSGARFRTKLRLQYVSELRIESLRRVGSPCRGVRHDLVSIGDDRYVRARQSHS